MEECSLPKARPISCSVWPAFQRRHTSIFCSAESPNRFPGFITTTFKKQLYTRWCCIDRLNRHDVPGTTSNCARFQLAYSLSVIDAVWWAYPMNRILLVSALFCFAASIVGDDSYFPVRTKTGDEGISEFKSKWYGQSLERMKEPRLP